MKLTCVLLSFLNFTLAESRSWLQRENTEIGVNKRSEPLAGAAHGVRLDVAAAHFGTCLIHLLDSF